MLLLAVSCSVSLHFSRKLTVITLAEYFLISDTFFGGSDPTWATPREQNSFFNGLALQING
jgi:hypothetical protein